ncbi:glycosyltransferase family A protein [Saccharicrinis sp. 156]|uniref:glycosyltransferase family A protein n=1 Tax=Saccharicrinis sp. 156 TaxID=3417574 RepID=UPI003D325E68
MSTVTFLMPVYNGELYIKEAIDSVLNQTYQNFELLIINDGSTDGTQAIIESYKDARIKCVQQENMGVSRSLNNGLSLIETPYIRRHDADDISEPDMLEKQMKFLDAHPEISFVSTQCAFMSNRSKVAYKYRQPKTLLFKNKDFILVKKEHFNPYSPIVHGTVLGPTKLFKEFNGYRTEFLTSEDNDLWLRIIEKYKFAVLNQCPYYLRLSTGSATQMHKTSVPYYRQLCLDYADERLKTGSDPITRRETVPPPTVSKEMDIITTGKKGKIYRNDLLDFHYKVMLNAHDWHNAMQCIRLSLKDGWKLKQTWKGILFPLLGEKIINKGVAIKRTIGGRG